MARPSVGPHAAGAIFTDGQAIQNCVFKPLIFGNKSAPEPFGLHFKGGDMTVSPPLGTEPYPQIVN